MSVTRSSPDRPGHTPPVGRSPLLITSLLAAAGGAAVYLLALPGIWRISRPYGLVFLGLGLAQLGTAVAALTHPTRRRVLLAAAPALAVAALWALAGFARVLPAPDPWVPVNSVIGYTGGICAGLQAIAVLGLAGAAALGPHRSRPRRILTSVALIPVWAGVLAATAIGVIGSTNGFAGAGSPAGTVAPRNLPAGQMSTVEYCRPDGVPLAMDLYMPPAAARAGRPAPVAMYVHGGVVIGDRKMYGAGAGLANHAGALFTPLQQQLNTYGFVVASVDYRLPPGTPWPAQIADIKCAVRFLRAHAADLEIDPQRIGVWGSSGGGQLSSLLALAGPEAGFDRGQYPEQSSAVAAVVDMFGGTDFTDFADSAPFARFIVQTWLSSSTAVRRSASPITYVAPGAPPFLILQGTEDTMVRPRHSDALAQRLQAAGVPVTLIKVQGAEHTLHTPGQRPSPEELIVTVSDFFTTNLR